MKRTKAEVKVAKVAKTNKGGNTMKRKEHTLGYYYNQWNRKAGFNDKFEAYNGKKKLTSAEIRAYSNAKVNEISIEDGDKLNYICWINTKGGNTMKKKIIEEYFDEEALKLDSMLLDGDPRAIASLRFSDGSHCELNVYGNKIVSYRGKEYRQASDYTKRLTTLMKEANKDDLYEDKRWTILENNWIEFNYWDKSGEYRSAEEEIVDYKYGHTKDSAKKFMLKLVKKYDKKTIQ